MPISISHSKETPPLAVDQPPSVLALIPAWNEAARVGPVIRAAGVHLPVLVVDDGSQDETAAIAQEAGATVARHPCNRGKGAALTTGFHYGLERGYEAVVTLDADGQHDPAEIPKFLAAHEASAGDLQLIIGRRDFGQMPFPRRYTNPLFGAWLLSLALQTPIHDSQSGYRLYGRRLLEQLDLTTTGFDWEVEVIIQAVCLGMPIGWVDIRTIYGVGEVSYFHPVRDSLRFGRMVWQAWRRRRRMKCEG